MEQRFGIGVTRVFGIGNWDGAARGVEKLQLAEVGPQAKFLTAPLPPLARHFP